MGAAPACAGLCPTHSDGGQIVAHHLHEICAHNASVVHVCHLCYVYMYVYEHMCYPYHQYAPGMSPSQVDLGSHRNIKVYM